MLRLILCLIFLLLFIQIIIPITQSYDYFTNCIGSPTYTKNSTYQTNLNNLLSNLTLQSSFNGFYNTSFGQNPNQVYGLYLCRGDIVSQDCSECVYQAHNKILYECPSQNGAIIWFDNCMLRFSNVSIFNRLDLTPRTVAYNPLNITTDEIRAFVHALNKTMMELVPQVVHSVIKYGTKESDGNVTSSQNKMYTLGQCTPDLIPGDCDRCLRAAIGQFPNMSGARVLQPSCNVRFEFGPFYTNFVNVSFFLPVITNSSARIENPSHPAMGKRHLRVVIVSIAISSIGILIIGIWIYMRKKNTVETSASLVEEMDEFNTIESLQFEWNTIKGATHNFSAECKLGEGGFGQVYKGILEDGQEIAVKRLSEKSRQGIVEFKTEIIVVAKLQHRNLVKLLGFCLAPKEKILVYEYLPNTSLDRFISDEYKRVSLIWETRFKIIAGIARGLLYLHEDSRLKIIHRDLKLSNILLDGDMNPKIADFGLAKLFEADETQGDTKRIVGTYGYMAPEYAMTGQFSVKSDVYSFGVIVLELVSGQRNRFVGRHEQEEALLHRAWRLWKEGSPLILVDTSLGSDYPTAEVTKFIHIGLLCIQDNAIDRPRMESVVAAINGHSISLPMPKAPTFFGDPRTTESQVYYKQVTGDIGYYQATESSKDCPDFYSGSQGVTDLYPRWLYVEQLYRNTVSLYKTRN